MRTAPPPLPRDPEFDHPARPTGRKPPGDVVGFYQRLFVNPFLAILTFIVTVWASDALGRTGRGGLIPGAVIVGAIASFLSLQFHCLDCGETGPFRRWRHHACPRIVERWMTPYSSASHFFPMPVTQLFLWFFAIVLLAIFWVFSHV